MLSKVRVTVSVERQGPPLDLLDSDVKLISAGRNDSGILGDKREPRDGEVGENVVVSILDGMEEDDGSLDVRGERRSV